jgi:hypothetical protein
MHVITLPYDELLYSFFGSSLELTEDFVAFLRVSRLMKEQDLETGHKFFLSDYLKHKYKSTTMCDCINGLTVLGNFNLLC